MLQVTPDTSASSYFQVRFRVFRSKAQQIFSKGGKIMAEKYSFLVLSDSGKYIKQTHCSRRIVCGIFCVLICLGLIVLFGIADYIRISRKDLNKEILEAELVLQQQELILHRQQIQRFAQEINEFKHRIVELNRIDQKIRRVAHMDESTDLFGIGGSAPEDLNPDLDPERNHTKLIKEMHRQVQNLKHAAVYQHYSLNDLWAVVEERGNFMAYTPTIRPAEGLISSPFGYRVSPFTGNREFHNGLDIANNLNTDIRATGNGRIAFAGERRGYGRLVMIDHGHGLVTRYAHLERIVKNRGDTVKRGEIIAHMGSTGRSTGTHLHYEVRLNGVPVNPLKFVF